MSPSGAREAWGSWSCSKQGVRQAGRLGAGHQRHTSLSLCSSQDLKFNCISKEINFKVTFYAV